MSKQSRAAQLIEHGIRRGYTPAQTADLLDKFELLAPVGEWEYRPEQLEIWGEWKPITGPTTDKAEAESWTATKQFKDATTRVRKRWIGQWEEA